MEIHIPEALCSSLKHNELACVSSRSSQHIELSFYAGVRAFCIIHALFVSYRKDLPVYREKKIRVSRLLKLEWLLHGNSKQG